MIAFLRGRVLEKHPNRVIVDVGGVGYDVAVPLSTFYTAGDVVSRNRDGDVVADTRDVDDQAIGMFLEHPAAQKSDHAGRIGL